jgi:hypothetical protein
MGQLLEHLPIHGRIAGDSFIPECEISPEPLSCLLAPARLFCCIRALTVPFTAAGQSGGAGGVVPSAVGYVFREFRFGGERDGVKVRLGCVQAFEVTQARDLDVLGNTGWFLSPVQNLREFGVQKNISLALLLKLSRPPVRGACRRK